MQQSVLDEPGNPRYWFYLAQGYETAGKIEQAIETYTHRATMGDYIEEVWYSHYRMAQLSVLLGQWDKAQLHYLDAYECQPQRAEPLYWLALGYHNRQRNHSAMMVLEQVALIDKPVSALFVEPAIYDYLRWVHYAVCLFNIGQRDEAMNHARRVLDAGKTPEQYLPVLRRIAGIELEAAHG
jgi:tetratricopeptide (TPR) repeat protein